MEPTGDKRAEQGRRLLFRRAQRLSLPAEFARTLRARPIAVSAHFQVFRPPASGHARLGVVVGKRFVRRSVDRNSIKRLVRELFRTRRFDLLPTDMVVRVRCAIPLIGRADTKAALRRELAKLLNIDQSTA